MTSAPSALSALKTPAPLAPAVFHAWQDFRPYAQPFRLFNLTAPVGAHPVNSTVSEMMLRDAPAFVEEPALC
jgi:hypothetical protein